MEISKKYHRRFVILTFSPITVLLMTACHSATQPFTTATLDVVPLAAETIEPDGESKTAEGETVTDNYQKGTTIIMASERFDNTNIIPFQQALILRNEERMGTVIQSIRDKVSEQLRQGVKEGIQISSGKIREDYWDVDELLLLFPAEPINGLMGQFILTLSVQSTDSSKPGILNVRRAWMVQSNEQSSARVEIKANAAINERWGYTRHPDVRQVYVAMFDDPDMDFEGQVFHQTVFPVQPSLPRYVQSETDWTTIEFILAPPLIAQAQSIDLCEALLEALDAKFAKKTGLYLQWSKSLVTLDTIETVASEVENSLLQENEFFNVTIEFDSQEIIRRKRIKPLMRYPLTLIANDGTRRAGTIGCSFSRQ